MDKNKYTIRDLERLTGFKPDTLRKWEGRYSLINPNRTPTNIRYYTDEDLRKLLNVKLLLEHGAKISTLSEQTSIELQDHVMNISDEPESKAGNFPLAHIHNLMIAALEFNEDQFEHSWQLSVERLGLKRTMTDIIYPLLTRVGLFWSVEKILPVQEHFLSCLVRKKLLHAIDEIDTKVKSKDRWLLFLHQKEDHEIPLLFSQYLLRREGIPVVYLGAHVPLENIAGAVRMLKPAHLLTFFCTHESRKFILSYLKQLDKLVPKAQIHIAGNRENFDGLKLPGSVNLLHTVDDLLPTPAYSPIKKVKASKTGK